MGVTVTFESTLPIIASRYWIHHVLSQFVVCRRPVHHPAVEAYNECIHQPCLHIIAELLVCAKCSNSEFGRCKGGIWKIQAPSDQWCRHNQWLFALSRIHTYLRRHDVHSLERGLHARFFICFFAFLIFLFCSD